jgi:N-glycosylase/DNA lyase
MVSIISDLAENDALRKKVDKRIFEFKKVQKADTYKWYEELVFCLLTAYSSANTGLKCVENLLEKNVLFEGELHEIEECITNEGHRFSKQRAQYIYETRHLAPDIKKIITSFQDSKKARLWLKKKH